MYAYQSLLEDLDYLRYNGADVGSIGKSELGYPIPFIHLGDYHGKQIIITYAIHARENVTSLLAIRQIYYLMFNRCYFEGGIYFVPMVNVDGALLLEKGAGIAGERAQFLLDINKSDDFSLWKANINGVDLNNNFDARFLEGLAQNKYPSSHGYSGKFPFSEAETRSLKEFTLKVNPKATISYHALGREIYYDFFQNESDLKRDREIANKLAEKLDYKLIDGTLGSSGGYKDWCIDKLKIPSFTIEIIDSIHSHPIDINLLDEDFEQNKDIPALLLSLI